jgi:hypothetical protein
VASGAHPFSGLSASLPGAWKHRKSPLAMFLAKSGPKKKNRKRSIRLKSKLKAKNKRRRAQIAG